MRDHAIRAYRVLSTVHHFSGEVGYLRPGLSTRRRFRAVIVTAVAGSALVLGVGVSVAAPTPQPSQESATADSPVPSQSEVDAAKAAEDAAARCVAALQTEYEQAAARLLTVQAEVSAAVAAYAKPMGQFDRLTKSADAAQARAANAKTAAEAADRLLRQDAAGAYVQGGGPMSTGGLA